MTPTAPVDVSVEAVEKQAAWHEARADTCIRGTSDWMRNTRTAQMLRALSSSATARDKLLAECRDSLVEAANRNHGGVAERYYLNQVDAVDAILAQGETKPGAPAREPDDGEIMMVENNND